MWGGVVAAEAAPDSPRTGVAAATGRCRYRIDLLVELPIVLGVLATGITAAILSEDLIRTHALKLTSAGLAGAVNLSGIAVVLRRDRLGLAGVPAGRLRRASRVVPVCFAVGPLVAAAGAWRSGVRNRSRTPRTAACAILSG